MAKKETVTVSSSLDGMDGATITEAEINKARFDQAKHDFNAVPRDPMGPSGTLTDKESDRLFSLKAALLAIHKSGYKDVLDLVEMVTPTEHQWQRVRHKTFDVMNEKERAMRDIVAKIIEAVKEEAK